jgi:hypothetical protein
LKAVSTQLSAVSQNPCRSNGFPERTQNRLQFLQFRIQFRNLFLREHYPLAVFQETVMGFAGFFGIVPPLIRLVRFGCHSQIGERETRCQFGEEKLNICWIGGFDHGVCPLLFGFDDASGLSNVIRWASLKLCRLKQSALSNHPERFFQEPLSECRTDYGDGVYLH